MEPHPGADAALSGEHVLRPDSTTPDSNEKDDVGRFGSKSSDDLFEGRKDTARSECGITEELRTLRAKIEELETLNQEKTRSCKVPQQSEKRRDEMEQYQQMAKCLYTHRKEWEAKSDNKNFKMDWEFKDFWAFDMRTIPYGPWVREWQPSYADPYERPNPFDPAHRCSAADQQNPTEDNLDEFDHVVDYDERRSRIRKAFEWEMDRLYLSEEIEIRRRKRLDEAKKNALKEVSARKRADNDNDNDKGAEGNIENALNQHLARSVDWHTFRQLRHAQDISACAVDILIGDPEVFDDWGLGRDWFRSPQVERRVNKNTKASKQAANVSSQTQLPERIRIHSELVLQVLDKILKFVGGQKMAGASRPIVFTRPFKALSYCEQGLDSWLLAMEKRARRQSTKWQSLAGKSQPTDNSKSPNLEVSTAENSAPLGEVSKIVLAEAGLDQTSESVNQFRDNTSSRPKTDLFSVQANTIDESANQTEIEGSEDEEENETNSDMGDVDAVAQSPSSLQELRFFLGVTRAQVLKRREYLEGDECHKVFFSDLWHLFRPGLEVIRSDGKQAYRVIHVTAAKHRTVSAFQKWSKDQDEEENKPRPDFGITCIYLDFDGKRLGPVSRTFEFKSFEGEKEITTFEVFPMRFYSKSQSNFSEAERGDFGHHSEVTRLRESLIVRGRRFLDAITTKHMFYAGATLDTHEDIEGQVVVDFEAAFIEETLATERPPIEALPSMNLDDYDTVDDCEATCCVDDQVLDDTFIDLRQAREYVNSLLPKTGAQNSPSIAVLPQTLAELKASFREISSSIAENELLILSNRVFGFILRNRKFAQLDVQFLSNMTTTVNTKPGEGSLAGVVGSDASDNGKTAFDRLVLEEGHKDMIESLISQHFRDKESRGGPHEQVDVVKGKGKGLILLLHGAPGVGKTSTAEGVAEMFGKPLFQITCGDLGTTAKEVEETLESNFALANRWGCILLLDEADVFLAERTKEDFVRNGLVAVFLRVLEYYSGILFLTTNRVGDFDEAFTSRIHMSLYYPELSEEKTLKVFKINLDLIRERFALKGRHVDIEVMDIGAFATQHYINHPSARWNGRQIRNACQTALALAEYQAQGGRHDAIMKPDAVVNLAVRHFETVRDAYLKFAEYMNKIYGTNAARKAKEGKLRAILVDENDNVISDTRAGGRVDRKEAFRQSQSPLQVGGLHQHDSPRNQHSQGYPQSSYQAQPTYQGPPQGYSQPQHQGPPPLDPYRASAQGHPSHYPSTPPGQTHRAAPAQMPAQGGQVTGGLGRSPGNSFHGSQTSQTQSQFDDHRNQRFSQQQGAESQRFEQDIQNMYVMSNQHDLRQGPAGHLTPSRGGLAEMASSDQNWRQGSSGVDPGMSASFDRVPRGGQ